MISRALRLSLLATTAVLATPGISAAKSCGTATSKHGVAVKVRAVGSSVNCKEARKVSLTYMNGGGKRHQGRYQYQSFTVIGRWRCGTGGGAGSCVLSRSKQRPRIDFVY